MSDMDVNALVLDNGSGFCKAGLAGDDLPRTIFPTILGHRNSEPEGQRNTYIGGEALSNPEPLDVTYPMEHGIIQNWEGMEKIWHNIFYKDLCVLPEDYPILLTEAPRNPKGNREKMAQIMFETFKVPALYISAPAVLSMYSSGRTTGISLESGDGLTHVIPIYEGYAIPEAINRVDLGGRDLTKHLSQILTERDYSLGTKLDQETTRDLKEKLCYVAQDFNPELDASAEDMKPFELPDGQKVLIGNERFRGPEILFQPAIVDVRGPGIPEMIHGSIMKCDVDIRKELFKNIIISGGNTMMPGFVERVTKDVTKMVPSSMKIKIMANEQRNITAWIGGSVLASLRSFQGEWVHKKEWEEVGPSIVSKKC